MAKPILITNPATGATSTYYPERLAREARAYCKGKGVKLTDWHVSINGADVALVVTYLTGVDNWHAQDRIAL